ncbi:MAG TPA: hypothetical protein VFC35_02295 [Gemmatimonadaceae bacterium]|nr:hypothetical protein [Gemmatimonadaceae bacterium]
MHNRLWIAAIVATTPILALSPVAFPAAHTAGCVRPVLGSMYNQRLFLSLMRRRDALAERTLAVYKVLRVKPKDVKPITDPATCSRAANAYTQVVHDSNAGRKVHILRVGNRYIVMDPDYVVDDYHRAVTFDSTFTNALALIAE